MHLGFQVEYAEHLHSVRRYCVFVMHHANVPEAQCLDQCGHDVMVWDWPVSLRGHGRRNQRQSFAINCCALIPDQGACF